MPPEVQNTPAPELSDQRPKETGIVFTHTLLLLLLIYLLRLYYLICYLFISFGLGYDPSRAAWRVAGSSGEDALALMQARERHRLSKGE